MRIETVNKRGERVFLSNNGERGRVFVDDGAPQFSSFCYEGGVEAAIRLAIALSPFNPENR